MTAEQALNIVYKKLYSNKHNRGDAQLDEAMDKLTKLIVKKKVKKVMRKQLYFFVKTCNMTI